MKTKNKKSNPPEIYLTAAEVARYLNVHKTTVLEWVKDDRFKGVFRCPGKIGEVRIPLESYKEFLTEQTQ